MAKLNHWMTAQRRVAGSVCAQQGGGGMEDMVRHRAVITHGTVMGFAFAFLFPLGAILIRVASFRGLIWVHAAIQSLAYALALAGLGLGIYIAVYPSSQVSQP